MKFRVEVICLHEDGAEDRCDVMELEKHELAIETLGLNLAEGKAILGGVQDFLTARQVAEDLDRRRTCPAFECTTANWVDKRKKRPSTATGAKKGGGCRMTR